MERKDALLDPWRFLGTRPLVVAAIVFVPSVALAQWMLVPWKAPCSPFLIAAVALAALGYVASFRFPAMAMALSLSALFWTGVGLSLFQAAEETSSEDVWRGLLSLDCPENSPRKKAPGPPSSLEVVAEGKVVSSPDFRRGRTRFVLEVAKVRQGLKCSGGEGGSHQDGPTWLPLKFKVRVSLEADGAVFRGDELRLALRIRPLEGPKNFGAHDTRAALARRGVAFSGSTSVQQMVALGPPPFFGSLVRRHRARFHRVVGDVIGASSEANLIQILGLGDRRNLDGDETLEESFRDCGLAHLFSVSGLHVGVVAVSFSLGIRRLLSRIRRLACRMDVSRLACLGAIPLLWLYTCLTGSAVPALRAAIMATCVFLARICSREPDSASALSLAALILLAFDPAAIASISFQLSFAAVASLMLFTRPIQSALPKIPLVLMASQEASPTDTSGPSSSLRRCFSERWREILEIFRRLALSAQSTLAATLAATLGTLPLVAMTFQQASLVAVVANLVALPLGALVTALSALSALCLFGGDTLAALVLSVTHGPASLLVAIVENLSELPFANLPVAAPKATTVLALYVAALSLLAAWMFPKTKLSRRLVAVALLTFLLPKAIGLLFPDKTELALHGARGDPPALKVIALSVGQGDAILLKLPDGTHILVDGGGELDGQKNPHWRIGKNLVVPSLKALGVGSLRALIMTHPHPDHALGLLDVVETFAVEEIWLPSGVEEAPLTRDIFEAVQRNQGRHPPKVRHFHRGLQTRVHEAQFQFIHPPEPPHSFTGNDESLAFKLSWGATDFLFVGDLETPGEKDVLAWARCTSSSENCPLLKAHVLKVGHHGSATSSSEEFLRAVRPQDALISCGKDNLFGFPSSKVLQRLRFVHAAIHRTDLSGALVISSDGQTVRTFKPFDSR